MVNPSFQWEKVKDEKEGIARAKERKRVERERNDEIEGLVERYGVVTPSLVCALMGINPEPQTTQEHTQKRIIYRRLQRLAEHKRFRVHSEYTILKRHAKRNTPWKKHVRTGAIYYVSRFLPKKEELQFEHKALIAHTRAVFEGVFEFVTFKTDTEMRDDKERETPLVYDLYGEVQKEAFAVECSRNSSPVDVSKKCQVWLKLVDRFLETHFDITSYRYLWVVETERKAHNIRDRWIKDGLKSGRLLVTWQEKFSPYTPESILGDIWLWPVDENLQSLRRT